MIKYIKIKDFAEVVSGSTPKTNEKEYWEGEYPWITPAEINSDTRYVYHTRRKLTDLGVKSAGLKLLKQGTVLLTSRAPIGKVAIAGIDLYCNQGFKNLICNEKIVFPKFLYYWLSSKAEYLNGLGRGATFKEISKSIVEEIEIPILFLEEQKKVAKVLDKAQELIDKRKEQIEACDELIKSLFYHMFGDPINSKKYKYSIMKDAVAKLTDGTHHSPESTTAGIPYITAKHLGSGRLDFYSYPTYVSVEEHEKIYARCNPLHGDVLYIKDGATTGIAAINIYDFAFSMLSSLALIKVKKDVLNEIYLVNYLNNKRVKSTILQDMAGGAIKRLTLTKINQISIMLPPVTLQNEFAQKVEKIEQQKQRLQQSLTELETNFNALMQRAFKGELF